MAARPRPDRSPVPLPPPAWVAAILLAPACSAGGGSGGEKDTGECEPLWHGYSGAPPTYQQALDSCVRLAEQAYSDGGWYREDTCGDLLTVSCGTYWGGDTWYFSDPSTLVARTWSSDDYSHGCYGFRPDCG